MNGYHSDLWDVIANQSENFSFFVTPLLSLILNHIVLGHDDRQFISLCPFQTWKSGFYPRFPNKFFPMNFEHMSISVSHCCKFIITITALERRHPLNVFVHFCNVLLNIPLWSKHFGTYMTLIGFFLFMHTLYVFFETHFIWILFSTSGTNWLDRLVHISHMQFERQIVCENFIAFRTGFLLT